MTDYERIEAVIRYLDEHHVKQPDLNTLAAQAYLSPHHFHRLFSDWAGITPKQFLQSLTLRHARELLLRGETVFGTALETGMSGPSRLHDLCVTLAAASPGEIKSGGTGWTIAYGRAETPLGRCFVAETPRGICWLSFIADDDTDELAALRQEWPAAELQRDDSAAARLVARIFATQGVGGPVPQVPSPASSPDASPLGGSPLRALVRGSAFRVTVWQALLNVPPGTAVTYGQLAEAIGKPKAARAVGSAVGSNALAVLIPCHRVIRATGVIGDYRWGTARKKALLAREGAT
jgi:AraC family transcriptional regulator of adaptative response/methylated-DNA-[protein]-cysteine methyltransferase